MRLHGLIYAACWLSLGTAQAQSFPQRAAPLSPAELQRAEARVAAALAKARPAVPDKDAATQVLDGRIALVGDLFYDGRRLAVIEDEVGLALAVFAENKWRLLTTWAVAPAWIQEGKTAQELGYYHLHPTPTSDPFKRMDLDGDAVPELLVAFNTDGYQLGHVIFKQTKGEPCPRLLEVFSARGLPKARAGQLLTFNDSGRKAWWGETAYHRWEKGRPVHIATWRDNAEEAENWHWQVSLAEDSAVLRIRSQDDAFFITRLPSGEDGGTEVPYAKVTFGWNPGQQPAAAKEHQAVLWELPQLHLFEKLCGLPAAAFGEKVNDKPIAEMLPLLDRLKVTVTGTEEAVRRLAPAAEKTR